jgi:hypothetical protein
VRASKAPPPTPPSRTLPGEKASSCRINGGTRQRFTDRTTYAASAIGAPRAPILKTSEARPGVPSAGLLRLRRRGRAEARGDRPRCGSSGARPMGRSLRPSWHGMVNGLSTGAVVFVFAHDTRLTDAGVLGHPPRHVLYSFYIPPVDHRMDYGEARGLRAGRGGRRRQAIRTAGSCPRTPARSPARRRGQPRRIAARRPSVRAPGAARAWQCRGARDPRSDRATRVAPDASRTQVAGSARDPRGRRAVMIWPPGERWRWTGQE